MIQSFVGRFCELHAARLATAARVNLSLHDHDVGAQALRDRACFVLFDDDFAARDRNAEFGEDRFGLIFVDLHADSIGCLRVAVNSARISGYRNELVYPEGERRARCSATNSNDL